MQAAQRALTTGALMQALCTLTSSSSDAYRQFQSSLPRLHIGPQEHRLLEPKARAAQLPTSGIRVIVDELSLEKVPSS